MCHQAGFSPPGPWWGPKILAPSLRQQRQEEAQRSSFGSGLGGLGRLSVVQEEPLYDVFLEGKRGIDIDLHIDLEACLMGKILHFWEEFAWTRSVLILGFCACYMLIVEKI